MQHDIVENIKKLWEREPGLRFCQLVENMGLQTTGSDRSQNFHCLFNVDDQKLAGVLRRALGKDADVATL